jgi:hypothetical protein
MSHYTKQLELILSKIHRPNNRHFSFGDCDTSLTFLRHDELQIWGLGTVGALAVRAKGLRTWDTGKLQAFNQPVNQSDNQTPNQSTGHSVSRPDFQTQHAFANRSGISASLMTKLVGGYKGTIIVACPTRLPQVQPSLSRSGILKHPPKHSASASLRRFLISSFFIFAGTAFFQLTIIKFISK